MARVLVVEDEPAIAESIAFFLRRDGFNTTVVATLTDAERELPRADLVILDLTLPDGSGFELLSHARRGASGAAIIVLSSRDSEADRVAALETGADDYVTKPFSPREVVARVRAVLRRAAGRPAPPARGVGTGGGGGVDEAPASPAQAPLPLRVEEATRRAYVHGQEVELTRVEFDLLACMLGAPGRVFTRPQLIDRVWGDGFAITDRTIDSHVKALRKKVAEAGGDAGLIETVRGVGYRVTDRPEPEGEGRGEA